MLVPVRSIRSGSKWLLGVLLVAALCCVPSQAAKRGAHKRDYRREIVQLEEQYRAAQLAGDLTTMDRLLSEEYVGISMTGQVNTKAQQLDRVRSRTLQVTKVDLSEMKVKLFDSIAVVTCLADVDGTNEGSSLRGAYRYTRVYQRLPSGVWKITNFESTRVPKGL